ncbi:XRE family transcriptional regulator [Kitasatospora sp. NPDC096128]|uniref:XRE family transcriptional regulator n=1 Tax=Kitasatospora sp. NPDC096128 TaxID=3155547 RepID=UPI0033293190
MPPHPKPGSKADRDALRTELLATGAPAASIASEMRTRFGCRPREAWRHAHGWTLQEAADHFNTAAGGAGPMTDASLLGKWEKWPNPSGRRVTMRVLAILADLYGATMEDLLDLEDRRALPESDLRLLRHHPVDDHAPAVPAPALPAPAAPLTGPELIDTAANESAAWTQWAEVTNVGPISLDQLAADTRKFAGDYLVDSDPLRIFIETKRTLDRVFGLLYGHQHLKHRRKLFTSAGYLSALLAWMTSDLGHQPQAETHIRAAMLCADMAADPGLQAWTCSTWSKIAFWDGQYREAIQHATRGLSYQAPGTVNILLHCQQADAWAEAGARSEAQAALGQAEEAAALELAGAIHDQVGGLLSCAPGRHANYGAAVHLRGGSADRALEHADRGLTALRQQRVHALGTEAQLHITRAGARLLAREPDGVLDALTPVLALPAEHRTAPVRQRLRDLARDTAASPLGDSAAGRQLQDAVETAVREAARALTTPTDWTNNHD